MRLQPPDVLAVPNVDNGNGAAGASPPPPAPEQRHAVLPATESAVASDPQSAPLPVSKNALKRLRRQQEWEDGKEERRKRRREKRVDRRERQREERTTLLAQGADPADVPQPARRRKAAAVAATTRVPVAFIVDCDFEAYMTDKELVSLASQATRCYSDNRAARYAAHLWMAGWAGKLRDRFRNVLGSQHEYWKGVGFIEGDFLACADEARRRMREEPGEMIAALQRRRQPAKREGEGEGEGEGDGGEDNGDDEADDDSPWLRDAAGDEPYPLSGPEPALNEAYRDVVYLTSESPYTLQRLEPHTAYVVGGLVDRNREKGLCYRRARERGIRTARLPIGQFMVMQSRQVLATNHVVEIMLKWLECEDWGQAFMAVIPKRKGGRLIEDGGGDEGAEEEASVVADQEQPAGAKEESSLVAEERIVTQDR